MTAKRALYCLQRRWEHCFYAPAQRTRIQALLTESQQEQSDFPRCIVGEWKCRETPLDNSELYSGYLSLIIRSDGNYLMYDAEAGNPCLKGTIEMDSDDLDLIFVDDSGVDFAPPCRVGEYVQKGRR